MASSAHLNPAHGDALHQRSDRQSLALTAAALDRIGGSPELLQQVLQTLDHWDQVAHPSSAVLRNAWRRILLSRDWSAALAYDDFGQQLRQASPLGRALKPRERWEIIRQCKGPSSST